MATIKVIQCDNCGTRVDNEADVSVVTVQTGGNVYKADYCPLCVTDFSLEKFVRTSKRGRKPKQAVAT